MFIWPISVTNAFLGLMTGCEKKQYTEVDPTLLDADVSNIAVLPFTSGVMGDWPSACLIMDELLDSELETTKGHKFLSVGKTNTVIDDGDLEEEARQWLVARGKRGEVRREFIEDLSRVVGIDAVLVGVLDWWGSAPNDPDVASSVAVTLAIVGVDGRVLFETSDKIHVLGESESDYRAGRGKGVAIDMVSMLVERIPGCTRRTDLPRDGPRD